MFYEFIMYHQSTYFIFSCGAQVMIVEMILSRYYRLDNHDKKISHSSSAQQQSHELQQDRVATQQLDFSSGYSFLGDSVTIVVLSFW